MVESMLVGCDLMGYIDGSIPCPPPYKITEESNVTSELAQEFKDWRKNDSALISLLAATLSSDALSFIVGSKSSKEVWYSLEERYAKISKFKAFEMKTSMQNIRKGNESVVKYMERFKSIQDRLFVAGVYIPDEDIMSFTLNGLPSDFTTIKTVIRAQETPISIGQLRMLLLDVEFDIAKESNQLASAPVNAPAITCERHLTTVAGQCHGFSLGTHPTPPFTHAPEHTVLPNNMNHVATAFAMNPTYVVNAMMQNGNFGVPLISNNGHMVTSTPNASAGSIVYPLGSNVVPTSEVVYHCGTPQPDTGLIHQIGTHPCSQIAQPAWYCNSIVGARKGFDQRRRARIHYQNSGWNCYRNQNNDYTHVKTSSSYDMSERCYTPDACQICNKKDHAAQVCSQ